MSEQNTDVKSLAHKNGTANKSYIANQLKQDQEMDQLSIFYPQDPFTGSK